MHLPRSPQISPRAALVSLLAGLITLTALPAAAAAPGGQADATASRARQSTAAGPAAGGALLAVLRSSSTFENCTSGFAWKTPDGRVRVLTAGHCVRPTAASALAVQYNRRAGARMGVAPKSHTRYGNGNDLALLAHATTPHAAVYVGGPGSNRVAFVNGQAASKRFLPHVCLSGGLSGESCGWELSSREAAYVGRTSIGPLWYAYRPHHGHACPIRRGDSGAPVYQKLPDGRVLALGILSVAGRDSRYCWAGYVEIQRAGQLFGGALHRR